MLLITPAQLRENTNWNVCRECDTWRNVPIFQGIIKRKGDVCSSVGSLSFSPRRIGILWAQLYARRSEVKCYTLKSNVTDKDSSGEKVPPIPRVNGYTSTRKWLLHFARQYTLVFHPHTYRILYSVFVHTSTASRPPVIIISRMKLKARECCVRWPASIWHTVLVFVPAVEQRCASIHAPFHANHPFENIIRPRDFQKPT